MVGLAVVGAWYVSSAVGVETEDGVMSLGEYYGEWDMLAESDAGAVSAATTAPKLTCPDPNAATTTTAPPQPGVAPKSAANGTCAARALLTAGQKRTNNSSGTYSATDTTSRQLGQSGSVLS